MLLHVSHKDERLIEIASRHADRSTMISKHGSVVTYKGKLIASGHNSDSRVHSRDGFIHDCASCHAEIDAIRNATKLVHR
jgi:deoxycytidylate deaminase